jgi:short-subunit dehydrogenase
VLYFSYSLRYQLRDKNISVSCLTPGPVFTKPSIERETRRQLGWFGRQMAVSPERVGEITVRKTLRGRLIIIPGTFSKISAAVVRILPRRVVTAFYNRVGKK